MILSEKSTFLLLLNLSKYITKREKRNFIFLIIQSLLVSFFETSVIFVLAPFLTLLVSPNLIPDNNFIFNFLNTRFDSNHIYLLGSLLVFLAISSAIMRSTYLYNERKFAAKIGTKLSLKAYSNVIRQPLSFHIDSKSSNIISNLTYINLLITGILQPVFQIISTTILAFGIVFTILYIYPKESIFMLTILISLYSSLSILFRRKIKKTSNLSDVYTKSLLKLQTESLRSIKEIILGDFYNYFEKKYYKLDKPLRKLGVQISILATLPRYIIESLAIALISIISMYFVSMSKNSEVLVVLGVLALAFQRLLPTVQQLYGSLVTLGSNKYTLIGILDLLKNNLKVEFKNEEIVFNKIKIKEIHLKNVTFKYKDQTLALKGIDLSIYKGEKIGIIGTTGGGKSTLINIILGLIKPSSGQIKFNNLNLDDNLLKNWHDQLNHVPQSIFLNDTSIYENISFGIERELISYKDVLRAAKDSSIHSFIKTLPNGYETMIGEGGIKLSGGQRQRIGIARALYKKKEFLILDEATNALDAFTENLLIEKLISNKNLTLIAICHRISMFKNFDKIVIIEKGRITRIGTFQELINSSKIFKKLLSFDK